MNATTQRKWSTAASVLANPGEAREEIIRLRAERAKLVEALRRQRDLCERGHGQQWAHEAESLLRELGELK